MLKEYIKCAIILMKTYCICPNRDQYVKNKFVE